MSRERKEGGRVPRRRVLRAGAALSSGFFAASGRGAAESVLAPRDPGTTTEPAQTSPPEITCGQTVTAELTEDDENGTEEIPDIYRLSVNEDTTAIISLQYHVLDWISLELEFRDENSSGTVSGHLTEFSHRITTRVRSSGEYTINVQSSSPVEGRDYTLAVDCIEPEGILECGETISCALGPDSGGGQDATGFQGIQDESFYDVFGFTGSRGQPVSVSMTTTDPLTSRKNPYLYLLDPEGSIIAEDDNSGLGFNALISAALPADGEYTVIATNPRYSYSDFKYGISLECPELEPQPIECGQTLSEELTRDDPSGFRGPGFHQDTYAFRGSADDYATLSMVTPDSEGGDPHLYLLGPNGSIVAMGGEFTHRLPADGEYTVVATSLIPRSFFSYELSVECFGGSLNCEGTLGDQGGADSDVSGELGPGDDTGFRGSNYYHDVYCFEGTDLDYNEASVSMADTADPRVYIVGPDGDVLAEGDTYASTGSNDVPVPSGQLGKIVVTGRPDEGAVEYELEYSSPGYE